MLVHIGFHKTATTWFQTNFFTSEFGFEQPFTHNQVYDLFIKPHDYWFDANFTRSEIEIRTRDCSDYPVMSLERLSGNPSLGARDSKVIADRIESSCSDVKVLIVIREQIAELVSIYKQYIQNGGTSTIKKYFSSMEYDMYSTTPVAWFDANHLRYSRAISHYRNLFGVDNVKVVLFEEFVFNAPQVCNSIREYCGLSAPLSIRPLNKSDNVSLSDISIGIYRYLNYLDYSRFSKNGNELRIKPRKFFRRGLRISDLITRNWGNLRYIRSIVESRFGKYYEEDNMLLAELLNKDIGQLGYRTKSDY